MSERDLLEEVRDATRALSTLALDGGGLSPRMAVALRATCDDVNRRLTSKELAILLVGPADGGKRTLINTAVGSVLLLSEAREPPAVVFVRPDDEASYVSELREGGEAGFSSALREKSRVLDEALSRAEREVVDAERELVDLRGRRADLRAQRAAAPAPPSSMHKLAEAAKGFGQRLRVWLLALVAWVVSFRRRLPGASSKRGGRTVALRVSEPETPAPLAPIAKDERFNQILAIERALLDAEPRLEKARAAIVRTRTEKEKHAAERERVFLTDVHALSDADARGAEIAQLAINHPCTILPSGLVLVDAPQLAHAEQKERDAAWERIRDDLGGCIVVSPSGRTNLLAPELLARLDPIAPHGVRGLVGGVGTREDAVAELATRLHHELPILFARIREESPTVVAAFVTRVVRDRLGVLTKACATTEAEIDAQIAELDKRRSAFAAHIRLRTLELMSLVITKAAERIMQNAHETLHTRLAKLGDEWRAAITACVDREAVDACIEQVNASAPSLLRTLCDDLGEQIAKDAQAAGEKLHASVLDQLRDPRAVQHTNDDLAAPVMVSIATGLDVDAVPVSTSSPFLSTQDAFERKRVGIGIGGAAAGAALGTLIFPGVGTAVGALVGVLAGFVEGTGALKRRAIEHVQAHGAAMETEIATRLTGAVPSVAQDLTASVDDTLERAITRREGSIAPLFEEGDRVIAREVQKIEELRNMRSMLATEEKRFVALAGRAGSKLQSLVAARARPPS